MVLIIDNYDSFTYNLVHLLHEVSDGITLNVCRNNAIALSDVARYSKIILSPGPGLPAEAGIMPQVIRHYKGKIPIFGVCLGLQAIGEAYGYSLKNLPQVYHGVQHPMFVTDQRDPLLCKLPTPFWAGRYHSWVIDAKKPADPALHVSCLDENGEIMAMYDLQNAVFGVQFHPESVMTPLGYQIMQRFLEIS